MSILFYFLWAIIGIGLASLFIQTQKWSVSLINPQKPKISKAIIIGGAIIRWLIIAFFLLLTLNHSILSTLILFSIFMLARIVIIFRLKRHYA